MFIGLSLLVIRTNTLFPLVASVISLMKLWLSRQSANLPVRYAFTPSSMSVLFIDGFNPRAGLDHFLLYNNPTQRYKITFTRNLVHVFSKQLPHQLKLIHCSMVLSLSFFLVQVELYVTRVTTHNTLLKLWYSELTYSNAGLLIIPKVPVKYITAQQHVE